MKIIQKLKAKNGIDHYGLYREELLEVEKYWRVQMSPNNSEDNN